MPTDQPLHTPPTPTTALVEMLTHLHKPIDEEAEFFYDAADGPSAHCPPDCTYDTCAGHVATIQVCTECGYEHDGESPQYRPWPCPTIKAVYAHQEAVNA